MPNPPTINQALPTIVSNKTSGSTVESKNNGTFNQVLKNEVAHKTKKTTTETQKNSNTNEHKTPSVNDRNAVSPQDKIESNDLAVDRNGLDEEQPTVTINDPGSLLIFVNNITEFSELSKLAPSLDTTTENREVTADPNLNNADIRADIDVTIPNHAQLLQVPTQLSSDKDNALESDQRFTTLPDSIGSETDINQSDLSTKSTILSASEVTTETDLKSQLDGAIALDQAAPEQTGFTNLIQLQSPVNAQMLNRQRATSEVSTQTVISETTISPADVNKYEPQIELKTAQVTSSDKFSTEFNAQLTQKQQVVTNLNQPDITDQLNDQVSKPEINTISQASAMRAEVIAAPLLSDHIGPRVGAKGWDQAIGQKIVWMVAGGEQSAQLTLNPPDLGPVQVVLSISDNFVDASFVSSHLDVREAIESAAPKLREMMENAGISLSGFSVSAESAQSHNQFGAEKSSRGGGSQAAMSSSTESETDNTAMSLIARNTGKELGLVDTFA
nr:flagellar hook-length control protein FliK [uncultured Undibacterium sp.]